MSKDSRKDGHKNMHGTPILANNASIFRSFSRSCHAVIIPRSALPDLTRDYPIITVSIRRIFQLSTNSPPTLAPSAMSVRRDSPLHMTVLPGGGSLARAR